MAKFFPPIPVGKAAYYASEIIMSSEFLGERVQIARKQQNLTTAELGERAELSQSAVSNIENGKRIPKGLVISALAQALGVREDWLRIGTDPMYQDPESIIDEDVAYRYLEEELGLLRSYIDDAEYEALHDLAREKLSTMRIELARKIKLLARDAKRAKRRDSGSTGNEGTGTVISGNFKNVHQIIGGNQTIITPKHTTRTTNVAPAGSVSEAQARELHKMLVAVGELETMRIGPSGYGSVMNQFKNRYGLTSYKNLSSVAYDEAVEYLKRRRKTLESTLLKAGRNPVTKSDFIRRIQTICRRELKWNDPIRREKMMLRYGKASLTQLSMAEIEDFYHHVSGLKTRGAKVNDE